MNCECNNNSNRVEPRIKHVYGNVLRMAIPLTLRTLVKDGDEMIVNDTDFIPSSDHLVRVVFSKGKTNYPIIATMDGNVAIVEDKGKIPVGTYDISVECYDDLGNPYRFKQNAVLYVTDTTAEAGIDEEIEYEAQTWYLNAAVFLATTEIGEIGDVIDAKLDDVFGNAVYDANAKEIRFYNKDNSRVLATIDSRPFIADGTVADVYIDVSRQVLVVVLNEDAGGTRFSVPLYLVFAEYYKKDEVDNLVSRMEKGLRLDFSQELPLVVPVTKNGNSISSALDFGSIDNAIREDGRLVVVCVNNAKFYQLLAVNGLEVVFSRVDALDGYQELLIVDESNVWSMEDVDLGTGGGGGGYTPPAGGIPKTDLAPAVQTSLGLADTALQAADKAQLQAAINAVQTALAAKANSSDIYTKAEVDEKVANAGKVKSVSVNGGAPAQPDAQGNVNINVQAGGLTKDDFSVETQGDGTVDINVKDDTYKINLNHTHENMAKLVVCEESDLPSTLDMDTIYAQVDNASSPTAIEKLWIAGVEFAGGGGTTPVLPYDARVEFLQSSGTQYIDTGIKPTTDFKCEIKAQFVQNNDDFDTLVGCYNGTNYGIALGLQNTSEGNKLYIQFGGASSFAPSDVTTTTALHTFITQLSNNALSINVDGTTNTASYSGSLPNMNLSLFARNKATIGNFANAKIYYCKIWNGGNLVFNAIPVRVDQVGYMYDKVSGRLLGNNGTGDFVLGGDIIGNGAYAQCDYVVPSSSSSIFTTWVTALGSKWELDLQDSATTSGNQIFICSNADGGCFAAVNSSGKFSLGASNVMTSASTRTTVGIEFIDKGMIMTIGGSNTQRVGTTLHYQYVSLLGYNGNYLYQGKIYGIKCVSGGSFNAIPARRISDGVYGLYDTANNVFYTNFTGS